MKQWIIAALAGCTALTVQAETLSVPLKAVSAQGIGAAVGSVKIESSEYGLVLRPELSGLEPGIHGFHVHAKGNCETAEIDGKVTPAGAAGGLLGSEEQRQARRTLGRRPPGRPARALC